MVLEGAFYSDDRRYYYVKKDIQKNKYYLQSFMENAIHLKEYYNKEYDKVKSRGIGIHLAKYELQVVRNDKCIPFFLEDFGYVDGQLPHRNIFVEGKLVFEQVKE